MTVESAEMLVFKSGAGEYFFLPRMELERGRVPEEHKAEVERLMALDPSGDGENDVQGHYWWIPLVPVAVDFISKEISGGKSLVELWESRNR
jgi:hypothetical protein